MQVVISESVEKLVLLSDEFIIEPGEFQMFWDQSFWLHCHKIGSSTHLQRKFFYYIRLDYKLFILKLWNAHYIHLK